MNQNKKIKFTVALTILVDVIGFGIVIPLLPFYVKTFSSSPLVVTLLFSVFSLCAFFSAPVLGALSDKIGRRPVLIVSIISTAVGWLVFASAHSLWLLFLGRIIDGLAAGNFSTAQSALSDIAKDEKERTVNLGLAGALFGVGFVLGPLLGGILGMISPRFVFYFVGAMALANALAAYFVLPETNQHINRLSKIKINPFLPLRTALSDKTVRPVYAVWLLFSLAAASQQSVFALYLDKVFQIQQTGTGLIMTGIGVIIALNQGFGLKHFWLKHFKENSLRVWIPLLYAVGLFSLASESYLPFFFGLFIGTFAQSVLRVTVTSQAVGAASPERRGEVMGVMTSLNSLGMIIGPLIAGFTFALHDHLAFWSAGIFMVIAFLVALLAGKHYRQIELAEVPESDVI